MRPVARKPVLDQVRLKAACSVRNTLGIGTNVQNLILIIVGVDKGDFLSAEQ